MASNRSLLVDEIPHLRRYARALLRDPEIADDLVQSCLERALSRFHLWRSDKRLRPWLFTIMHNLHVNAIRYRSSRPPHVELDETVSTGRAGTDQEDALHTRAVLAAIDRLPEDQRAVVILVGIDELSYRDAAAALDIPLGTLMSRLHRGRERLRETLGMTEPRPAAIRRVK